MREIKFRAWDMVTVKMVVWEDLLNKHDLNEIFKYGYDLELMQYTGLKDKNGVEIYEGDIITTDLQRQYLIVEYRNGAFMLNCNDGEEDYYDIFFSTYEEPKKVYKYGEVVGNIYDNPELMEE